MRQRLPEQTPWGTEHQRPPQEVQDLPALRFRNLMELRGSQNPGGQQSLPGLQGFSCVLPRLLAGHSLYPGALSPEIQ